jgi:plastocyanin domain-containing protein
MIAALNTFRRGAHLHAAPTTRIRVRGGYSPDTIYGRVGEPLRLVFRREETAVCSEQVVFPHFGKSAMLPPYQDVTVELLPEHAGEYAFTCQMGMLHGRLVIEEAEAR